MGKEPLYQSVINGIIARIASGDYPPGSMLPSEFDLGAEFGVSQGTARKALSELELRRIVQRRQGLGTFVTLRTPENSLFHFFPLRTANGDQVVPELAEETIRRRKAKKAEKAVLFGAPDEVFEIDRVRHVQGKPLCHETSVVPCALFPGLLDRAPLPNTLYVLFQQAYSIIIISARESLAAEVLSPELSERMGLEAPEPVIVAHRQGLDLLERVVELRICHYLTGSASYMVEMD